MQRVHVCVLGCVTVLAASVPVSAQTVPRTEISGGYQFLSFSFSGESESLPAGWYFDVAGNLTPMLGIVFQVGGNYKSFDESFTIGTATISATADLKVHEFMGGLRLNARLNPAVAPYGQFLVGGANASVEVSATSTIPGAPFSFEEEDSGTDIGFELGGGVNFTVTQAVGVRVGADYLRFFAEDEDINVFRFHVGIVLGR